MRCRSLVVSISLIALNAVLACESERPIGDDLLRIDAGEQVGGAGGQSAEDASAPSTDAAADASAIDEVERDASGPSVCETAQQAFEGFVAANRSCSVSSDCTIIGDCSPNADFRAIRVDAAATGYALMVQRCASTSDGPTYAAICQDGECVLGAENGCCGCPGDAGINGD
jgi:hypothetical protein